MRRRTFLENGTAAEAAAELLLKSPATSRTHHRKTLSTTTALERAAGLMTWRRTGPSGVPPEPMSGTGRVGTQAAPQDLHLAEENAALSNQVAGCCTNQDVDDVASWFSDLHPTIVG